MFGTIKNCALSIAALLICFYLYPVANAVFRKLRYKEKIERSKLHIDLGDISILLVCIAFCVKCLFFGSTTIGSFWEYSNYTQDYEAIVYIDDKAVFCIAEIERYTEEDESYYFVNKVYLPFGKTDYPESEYNPKKDDNSISLGTQLYDCNIVLKSPAKKEAYDLLANEVVAQSGEICASKKEDVFHSIKCRHAKKISRENLIFFETTTEAEAFGYVSCYDCNWW